MERLKNIKHPLLKDKFKKYGDSFELVSKNESNRMYCYRRTTPEGIVYFEVFRSNLEADDIAEDGTISVCLTNESAKELIKALAKIV